MRKSENHAITHYFYHSLRLAYENFNNDLNTTYMLFKPGMDLVFPCEMTLICDDTNINYLLVNMLFAFIINDLFSCGKTEKRILFKNKN